MSLSGEPKVGVVLSKCHGDPGVVYPMAGAVPLIQSSGCFDYMCSLEEDIKTDLLVTLPPSLIYTQTSCPLCNLCPSLIF